MHKNNLLTNTILEAQRDFNIFSFKNYCGHLFGLSPPYQVMKGKIW